jgi:hypothetical protein
MFFLFIIWTKYNSVRGGKRESRNRTDSFESEPSSPLDKRSPAPFFTTYPRTSTTTSFILSGPSFFIAPFYLTLHLIQFHLPPTSTYSTFDLSWFTLLPPFRGVSICQSSLQVSYQSNIEMDNWRVAVLGDGGVGKTALAVQVCWLSRLPFLS